MKRYAKKIALICLVLTLFINCIAPLGYAQTIDNIDEYLIKNGVSELAVKVLDAETKAGLFERIKSGEIESVSSTSNVTAFDELTMMESLVNNTAEELGMSQAEYDEAMQPVKALAKMTDSEVIKKYHRTSEAVKLMRMAITPVEEEKVEKVGTVVSTSGTIEKLSLEFSMDIYKLPQHPDCKDAIRYEIITTYDWFHFPYCTFTDEVAVAFGGDFYINESPIYSVFVPACADYMPAGPGEYNGVYYNKDTVPALEDRPVIDIDWTYEITPNEGIIFYNDITMAYTTAGVQYFRISKNHPSGERANVVAQYAHQLFPLSVGLGIYGASISATSDGFDYSEQLRGSVDC